MVSRFSKLAIFIAIFISISTTSTTSYSQTINDALRLGIGGLGSNARALGMGNSYMALSDDASAAFFNPAGFGLLKRLEFSGGLEYVNYKNDAEFFGNTSNYSNSSTRLNRISFAFPFPTMRGSLVFGLSYQTTKDLTSALEFDGFNAGSTSMIQNLNDGNIPYDLYLTDADFVTPIMGRLNQSGTILNEGALNSWTFSGAIEVYKNVFIGANLNINTGSFESNNEYYEDDTRNIYQSEITPDGSSTDFQTFYLNRLLQWDISGWDAKLGMLYQVNPMLRFGATIQFPKTFSIKEDFIVNARSEFADATHSIVSEDYNSSVEFDIITPFELGAGLALNYKGLIFSAEGTIIDYSQTEMDNVVGISQEFRSDYNRDIKDLLRAVINYNLGLEYTIPEVGLRVRGGFLVKPSPYEGDESDYDRKYFTVGIGFLADETIGFDLGYAHGWWKDFGDNYGSNVSRTFQDVTDDHFVLTFIYRF